ncbi:MAG: site-specific DNA-methyltransferase [Bacteriovoracaceae bacterium]|jgi:site-specific DNA-methyltransferase (adenine-specific)|nr:site-specific DNA-methyltransferase [Bacteriovoracaceae bacterium]
MLYNADCLDVLKTLETNSIDSIVCDPPYGINIMDKGWDQSLPINEIWKECYRVLRPGGHILAFSSARLYHHLAISMEQAGFDTFNMLNWIYNSGLPKGKNLSREFDRTNDIPKPDDAFRKYLRDAIKSSQYKIIELESLCGTSGMFSHYLGKSQPVYPSNKVWSILKEVLELDETYDSFFIELEKKRKAYRAIKEKQLNGSGVYATTFKKSSQIKNYIPKTKDAKLWDGWKYGKQSVKPCMEPIYFGQKPPLRPVTKNIKNYGVGALNIKGCKSKGIDGRIRELSSVMIDEDIQSIYPNESKSLSLFKNDNFYFIEKPSKAERTGNFHPTLKPVLLMRKLVRLVTPSNGLCLDPFMGSGTTGVACREEEIRFIGIEKEREYFELAKGRIQESEQGLAA